MSVEWEVWREGRGRWVAMTFVGYRREWLDVFTTSRAAKAAATARLAR